MIPPDQLAAGQRYWRALVAEARELGPASRLARFEVRYEALLAEGAKRREALEQAIRDVEGE